MIEKLRECFSYWWKEIFALSIFRLIHQLFFKHARLHYQDSWVFTKIPDAHLDDRSLHNLLEEIRRSKARIVEFLKSFISKNQALLIDLTHVFCLKNMTLAARGYNNLLKFTELWVNFI